jgi:predicted ester cyclase
MSFEFNKNVARRYFEAYSKGDIEAVMSFIDADYVLHSGAGAKAENREGRKRDEEVFFSAFSGIEAVVEDQIAEGEKVANRITMVCNHTGSYKGISATGKRVVIPYIDIVRFKAGKIVEEWVEFDTMHILDQIKAS